MLTENPRQASPTRHDPGRTWFLGGSLLLVAHVVSAGLQPGGFVNVGGGTIATLLYAAALLVFAFGFSRAGSVTARRPLGTAAVVALALWTQANLVLELAGASSGDIPFETLMTFGYIDIAVQFALAVIAAIQIARADVIPKPWNWAPAAVVAALTVSWLLQLALTGVVQNSDLTVSVLLSLDSIIRVGGTLFLGVLAIVLATHAAAAPAEFPATPERSAR